MLLRRFKIISARESGAVYPSMAFNPFKDIFTGNKKLAKTATMAANNVLSMYNTITVRNFEAFPPFALAIDDATRINTRIGAMPFNAPTKSVPGMAIQLICGSVRPRMAPATSPINILKIRLKEFHFLIKFMIKDLLKFPVNLRF